LSQPHEIQERLFPGFVEVADELALNWEEATRPYLNVPDGLEIFTIAQRAALSELDNYLMRMSGKDNLHKWTLKALAESADWETVRNLATQVLTAMKWPLSPPPGSLDLYIHSRS
jgi:hypothetical protein